MPTIRSTPARDKGHTTYSHDPSAPAPQQAMPKNKNKKASGGNSSHPRSAEFASSSTSAPQYPWYSNNIKSHRDDLREHLGPKTFKKLIDSYFTATVFLFSVALFFFSLTSSTLPDDATSKYLPNSVYIPFIRWWYLRLWLGISSWHFLSTLFLEWVLKEFVLPLIFLAYTPTKLVECISKATNDQATGQENAIDDPTDAFVGSAPQDNGNKHSYSVLAKLFRWQDHGDGPRLYQNIISVVWILTDLWLFSFATGGGWPWLGAVVLYLAIDLSIWKFYSTITSAMILPDVMYYMMLLRKMTPLIGLGRIAAHLVFRAYTQSICPHMGGGWIPLPFCSTTILPEGVHSHPPFYKGSDVELIFKVLLYDYPFFGVVFVTSMLVFASYLLSRVKPKHLPQWWWIICPKKVAVDMCLYLSQKLILLAWIPATRWMTAYTLEFIALYGYMLYYKSVINIPYAKTHDDYGPHASLNPLLVFVAHIVIKCAWFYLIWKPWLPLSLFALLLSTSRSLQRKMPGKNPGFYQTILFLSSTVCFFTATTQHASKLIALLSAIGFPIVFLTPLGTYVESFINSVPLPNIDDLLNKIFGGRFGGAYASFNYHSASSRTDGGGGGGGASETIPKMMDALPIPPGATLMVRSILAATNFYSVLGMTSPGAATDEALRKAKRSLSLATHPDKSGGAPGAVEACQRVLQAADVLLDPEKRRQYDEEISYARIAASGTTTEIEEELADIIFEKTGVDITQKDFIMVSCDCCALGVHQAPVVPGRTAEAARYCAEHNTRHPVAEQESWIEKESAGLWSVWSGHIFRLYTCHQGKVYDISDAAQCAGLLQIWARSGIEANSHENYYSRVVPPRVRGSGSGGKKGTGGGKKGSASGSGVGNSKPKSKKGKKGRR